MRTNPVVSVTGLVLAWLGYLASLTPTMVPRTTSVQLIMSVVLPVTGYGVGALLGAAARALTGDRRRLERSPVARRVASTIGVLAAITALAVTPVALGWQTDLAQAAGWAIPSWPLVVTMAPPAVVAAVITGRALRLAGRVIGRAWHRFVPSPAVSTVLGGLTVVVLFVGIAATGFALLARQFTIQDDSRVGQPAPTSELRSGGPGSLVAWETLGRQGRAFVGGGPSAAVIAGFSGEPALEPIRAYVGKDQAGDAAGRAALLVDEVRRAGGFDRSALVVVVTSGLGSVHPVSAQTAEYVANGDIATAATQYSSLPSWMTGIVDRGGARREAEALVAAFTEAIAALPEGQRPDLYLSGESLGASGSQQVFVGQSPQQVTQDFDGVLWVGTPATSTLLKQWAEYPEDAPPWEPVVGDGSIARFAASPQRLQITDPTWSDRRILFLHSPLDPVAHFSGSLLVTRPAWLGERQYPRLPERMAWWPLFTWEQVFIDFTTNGIVPPGFGHNYSDSHAAGWAAVMHPPGWDQARVDALREYRAEVGPPDPGQPTTAAAEPTSLP